MFCRLLGRARCFGAHGGEEGRGHIVAAASLQLVCFVIPGWRIVGVPNPKYLEVLDWTAL